MKNFMDDNFLLQFLDRTVQSLGTLGKGFGA